MALETEITLNKTSYRTLFDSLPGALLIIGFHRGQLDGPTECRILDVNSEFEAFCGLSRDELLGKKPADLFPRFEEGWGLERCEEVIRAGHTLNYVRFCERLRRWYDITIIPLEMDGKGAIIFSDITDKKKAAELSRKNQAKQAYFTNLAKILRKLDGPQEIQNAVAELLCRRLGACRASFIEGTEIHSAADGSENGNLIVPVMRRDKPTVHLVIVPDGGRIWTEDEVYLSHATAQRTWLAVERAKAHQALQQSEQTALALVDRLKSADRGKNEMIAILSHELRNPMAVMAAALDLFELDSEDGKSKKTIDTIRNQLEQLTKIVDDLRDLARIVGPGLQLAKETIDLRMVVMNVTRGLDSAFKEKGVELVQSIPFHPIIVKIDPPRVIQSLETVLGHALNFTPANGTVKLTLEDGEDSARVEIKDEGPGLSPGLLDNVFEPFVQAGSAGRRRVTGGVGVGLAIVKDVFNAHNGWVEANNHPSGKGAVFILGLPLEKNRGSNHKAGCVSKDKLAILCIEDNTDLAQLLQAIFEKLGHEAHLAYNGEDGLTKAKELLPDIIFCDVGLEDITGYDVAKHIRGCTKLNDTLLVALTGYASKQDRLLAKQSGFDLHVAKPFKIETIEQILARYMDAKG